MPLSWQHMVVDLDSKVVVNLEDRVGMAPLERIQTDVVGHQEGIWLVG